MNTNNDTAKAIKLIIDISTIALENHIEFLKDSIKQSETFIQQDQKRGLTDMARCAERMAAGLYIALDNAKDELKKAKFFENKLIKNKFFSNPDLFTSKNSNMDPKDSTKPEEQQEETASAGEQTATAEASGEQQTASGGNGEQATATTDEKPSE